MSHINPQVIEGDWVPFKGGELEGRSPKALCPSCRQQGKAEGSRTLCFRCYRAGVDRDRALQAAGNLDTASEARFQGALPFEPVNLPRLDMLKAERAAARASVSPYVDKRRQAQIAARHALQRVVAGLAARRAAPAERSRALASAVHAAELQLPESWMPFVVSR